MKNNYISDGDRYIRKRRFQKRWQKVTMVLASIVVFCTTYALILPAITMEKGCQLSEHTHSDACYTQVVSKIQKTPSCTLELHEHDESCRDAEGNILCGYADFVVHQHDSACYDESGELWCVLPEIEEHQHSDSCFAKAETHTHGEECYTIQHGELTCEQHVHTESCWAEEKTLICGLEEASEDLIVEVATDADAAYEGTEDATAVTESSHQHDDTCYQVSRNLTCGYSSDHEHSDACYVSTRVLTCEREETGEEKEAEQVLTCAKEEVSLHCHTEKCFDETDNLICENVQILWHQHGDGCFTTEEVPVDTEALTCTITEGNGAHTHVEDCYNENRELACEIEENAGHQHGEQCYGIWERICNMEEHIHSQQCGSGKQPEIDVPHSTLSNLPILGNVYAMTDSYGVTLFDGDDEVGNSPLDIAQYIKSANLLYKTDEMDDYIPVGDGPVPGNASFKLVVDYEGVNISDLENANRQMTFSLPILLRGATAQGSTIMSGTTEAGTVSVSGDTVTITFHESWLSDQKESGQTVIEGDFYVEGKVNLSQIPDGGKTEITIGGVKIDVMFDGDLVAKYGEVKIEKSVGPKLIENEEGDWLEYTLTVTAGEDGCPEVKVVDETTVGNRFVFTDESGNITVKPQSPDGVTVSVDGRAMTWTIGNMTANEVKTLVYRVRLVDGYAGVPRSDIITNKADVYSKEYHRGKDTASFQAQGKATLKKTAGNYTPNTDGTPGGKISYTVWVKALDSNTHSLDNVTIWDALDGTVTGGYKTEPKELLPYLSYSDFNLQKKDSSGSWIDAGSQPTPDIAANHNSFKLNIGTLQPGEEMQLIYTVNVAPGAFTITNNNFKVDNRATILSDPTRTDGGNQRMENYNASKSIEGKKWSRKLAGEPTTNESTISTGADSFTVPAGSYKYQVVVNEAGGWNVSSAVMKDSLGSGSYMHYIGYVQVNAYKNGSSYSSDSDAADGFAGKTPDQTIWVKVDGQKSFQFTPQQLGFLDDTYAYVLTYYAVPENTEQFTQVIVANEFDLTGTVGYGDMQYTLTGIHVSYSVTLQGTNYFRATKQFWKYDASVPGQTHGALYWVIQAQGGKIPVGTQFKDTITEGNHKLGKVESAFIAQSAEDVSDWENVTGLPGYQEFTNYTTPESDPLILELSKDVIPGDGNSLYFVITTYPTSVPESNGASQLYKNGLATRDPGEKKEWITQSEDQHYIVGGENIYKQVGAVIRVKTDANGNVTKDTREFVTTDNTTEFQYDHLTESGPGIYVAWKVTINQASTLSGRYRIIENIPVGMDVVYIQQYSCRGYEIRPYFVDQNEIPGYEKVTKIYNKQYDQNPIPAYYYVKGQEVFWDVAGLETGSKPGDKYVTFLVVCKVTDEDVLQGGATKHFENKVKLQDTGGDELGSGSAGVEVTAPRIGKRKDESITVSGGTYPFIITLNELGTDLMSKSDRITLVDELGENLTIDSDSIKVVHTETMVELEQGKDWTSSVEEDGDGNQTLKVTLPDDQPLTVTYNVIVNAPPA